VVVNPSSRGAGIGFGTALSWLGHEADDTS
jgi:hypothetical protein